jgi:hypothetical protein
MLSMAFKEWSVICRALELGLQTLILRKGGIDEGRDGFQVAHDRFWLYPTRFHASREQLSPLAVPLLDELSEPPSGQVVLTLVAEVTQVHALTTVDQALAFTGLHGWSDETIQARFQYRQPGLFLLVTRISALPVPVVIEDAPAYTGCKSWVPLVGSFDAAAARPVLDEARFAEEVREIQRRVVP